MDYEEERCESVDGIQVASDSIQWKILVKPVLNLRVF
jgi:hypothetical protein